MFFSRPWCTIILACTNNCCFVCPLADPGLHKYASFSQYIKSSQVYFYSPKSHYMPQRASQTHFSCLKLANYFRTIKVQNSVMTLKIIVKVVKKEVLKNK